MKQAIYEQTKQKADEYEEKSKQPIKEEVCSICGLRPEDGDGMRKFSHTEGKVHIGFVKVRKWLADLKEKSARLEEDRKKDKESKGEDVRREVGNDDEKKYREDRGDKPERDRGDDRDRRGGDRDRRDRGRDDRDRGDRGRDDRRGGGDRDRDRRGGDRDRGYDDGYRRERS